MFIDVPTKPTRISSWCLVCQKDEDVMLDSVTRRPACTKPVPERRIANGPATTNR